jgi:hypothetical protein
MPGELDCKCPVAKAIRCGGTGRRPGEGYPSQKGKLSLEILLSSLHVEK